MIDRRKAFIDNTRYVWQCIICDRKQVSETQPKECACGQAHYVINESLIVTK